MLCPVCLPSDLGPLTTAEEERGGSGGKGSGVGSPSEARFLGELLWWVEEVGRTASLTRFPG